MFSSTMLPEICSKISVYHATITPCNMTNYYVSNDVKTNDDINDALTPEQYICFKTLLMKIITKNDVNITKNHAIEIIHNEDH